METAHKVLSIHIYTLCINNYRSPHNNKDPIFGHGFKTKIAHNLLEIMLKHV